MAKINLSRMDFKLPSSTCASKLNDGEFGRISWLICAHERLSGFEQRPVELKYATAILKGKKDREEFADYYSEFATRAASPTTSHPARQDRAGECGIIKPSVSDRLPIAGRPCFAPRSTPSSRRSAKPTQPKHS